MQYTAQVCSPLGNILMAADEIGLIGLWFEGQKHFGQHFLKSQKSDNLPIFDATREWLNLYFSGREPDVSIPIHFIGTDFQKEVWQILCNIPYGKTVTYGEIAKQLAEARGIRRMSAQAVGGAVGRNPISIIVPCHRVVGAGGELIGYAGGTDKKIMLLRLEKQQKQDNRQREGD